MSKAGEKTSEFCVEGLLVQIVLLLSLASAGYGIVTDPRVIGNWENNMDGWFIDPLAPAGTAISYDNLNGITLDSWSLKLFVPAGGWQQAISIDIIGENLVEDFFDRASFSVDVTLLSAEWQGPGGFCDVHLVLEANSDLGPVLEDLGERLFWSPGGGDITKTAAWDYKDIKEQIDQATVTTLKLIIVTNYDPGFIILGNYYLDNAQLLPFALKLDFNLSTQNGPAETEGSFIGFTQDMSGDYAGDIKVKLFGNLKDCRNSFPSGVSREQIYRDFIFAEEPSGMRIVLTGLGDSQECEVTIYAFDWQSTSSPPRQANWYANGEYLLTTEFAGNTTDPSYPLPDGENYAFTGSTNADAAGRLILEAVEGPDNGGENFAYVNALFVLPTSDFVPVTIAHNPIPEEEQVGISMETDLSWTAGAYAAEHDVYFGTSSEEVNEAGSDDPVGLVYKGRQSGTNYPLSGLDLETTYYWRVDEVNDACEPYLWRGFVWGFTITDYISIDDFEDYTVSDPIGSTTCPYYATDDMRYWWMDGHIPDSSGYMKNPQDCSQYNPMLYEGTAGKLPGSRIIRTAKDGGLEGDYGMSYYYNNNDVVNALFPPENPEYEDRYSEICRYFVDSKNFLTGGKVNSGGLVLFELSFIGNAGNAVDPVYDRMYVVLEDMDGDEVQINHSDPDAARITELTQWPIKLSDFTDINPSLDLDHIGSIRIGFGKRFNKYTQTPGGVGTVVFDNIRLYSQHCVLSRRSEAFAKLDYAPIGNPAGDCVIDYREIAIMADEWLSDILPLRADVYKDDIINFRDFSILAEAWLEVELWPDE